MTEQANVVRDRRLVRARVKPVEMLPEWAKCCEERLVVRETIGELLIDLSQIEQTEFCCHFCKSDDPDGPSVYVEKLGFSLRIDLLDLDEGPYQEAV